MARSNFRTTHFFTLFLFLLFPIISNAGVVVLNGLTHLHDVVPGETYRGEIEVQNTANSEQAVKIYAKDYSFNFHGEAFYEEPGTNPRSNAGWIDVSPKYLVLQPKEKTFISYEIKIPADGSFTGTYWSVLMVEGETVFDEENLKKGLTIQTQLRYAIQIVSTFNTPGERNLTFFDAHLIQKDGTPYLAVDVVNKGEFLFKPDVSVELFDESGESVGILNSTKKKIYPDTSARFLFEVKDVETGKYQSLILADCDEEDIFGINIDLEINGD